MAVCRVWWTPAETSCAVRAISPRLPAISPEPLEASEIERFISLVVAVCSSTAAAMVLWVSEIWAMISVI
ncbi:MAG: hypothetical protein R2715_19320 [Ilumatobacteraceae bacterium]